MGTTITSESCGGNAAWIGDSYCDDANNNEGCQWDGGDCCGDNVNTQWCQVCACLDPGFISKSLEDILRIFGAIRGESKGLFTPSARKNSLMNRSSGLKTKPKMVKLMIVFLIFMKKIL